MLLEIVVVDIDPLVMHDLIHIFSTTIRTNKPGEETGSITTGAIIGRIRICYYHAVFYLYTRL